MNQILKNLNVILEQNKNILSLEKFFIVKLMNNKLKEKTHDYEIINLDEIKQLNGFIIVNDRDYTPLLKTQIDFVKEYNDKLDQLGFLKETFFSNVITEEYHKKVRDFNVQFELTTSNKYSHLRLDKNYRDNFWEKFIPLSIIKYCLDNNKTICFHISDSNKQDKLFVGYDQKEMLEILEQNNISYIDYLKQFKETKPYY